MRRQLGASEPAASSCQHSLGGRQALQRLLPRFQQGDIPATLCILLLLLLYRSCIYRHRNLHLQPRLSLVSIAAARGFGQRRIRRSRPSLTLFSALLPLPLPLAAPPLGGAPTAAAAAAVAPLLAVLIFPAAAVA